MNELIRKSIVTELLSGASVDSVADHFGMDFNTLREFLQDDILLFKCTHPRDNFAA